MTQFNKKVDEYIAKSADFAKPIFKHLLSVQFLIVQDH